MSGKYLLFIVLGGLLLVAGIAFFVLRQNDLEGNGSDIGFATPTPIPEAEVPGGFVRYESDEFVIHHHPDMEVRDEQLEPTTPIAFVLIGPTQEPGTELYDGINLSVFTGNYTEQNFRSFVENEMQEISEDGISEVLTDISSVNIGNKEGLEFMTRGLGEFRHIYFDAGNNRYVYVTLFVEDPTEQGFEQIAEQMLLSLQF